MCRLYAFRANEPTRVDCSLVRAQNALLAQSRGDRAGESHPDGWGIARYENSSPIVERRTTAAYDDLHFSTTAERTYSNAVVAHVRKATVGPVTPENTHPFAYGRWVFAHNGSVRAFDRVGPGLEQEIEARFLAHRRGQTDSELAFHWILDRMARAGLDPEAPDHPELSALVEVVGGAVRHLDELGERIGAEKPAKLNFVLTDGRVLVASRWRHSLHWLARAGIQDCEICGRPHVAHTPGRTYREVLIASEPISGEAWQEVPDRSVIAVDTQIGTRIQPIG